MTRVKRKRILLLDSALDTGGAERVVAHLVRGIDPARFEVAAAHLMKRGAIGDELAREGNEVVAVERNSRAPFRYLSFRALGRLLDEREFELVHSHTHYALTDAALCKLLVRRNLRVVHTFHYGNYPRLLQRYKLLEGLGARVVDRLVAVGHEQARAIRATYRLRDDRIEVVPNGAQLASEPIDAAWQSRLHGRHEVVIGTICTFIEQKGLPDLLEAAALLKARGVRACFVLVGDGVLRPAIEARCQALGLADCVLFTGAKHGASSSMLPLFDIFFQPSLWEAMSMVVIEAMAAGKPVVATSVGDNRHVVVEGVTGRIVPPGDTRAMADALEALAASPDTGRHMGAAGLERYRAMYTVKHMVDAYQDLYLDVLGP